MWFSEPDGRTLVACDVQQGVLAYCQLHGNVISIASLSVQPTHQAIRQTTLQTTDSIHALAYHPVSRLLLVCLSSSVAAYVISPENLSRTPTLRWSRPLPFTPSCIAINAGLSGVIVAGASGAAQLSLSGAAALLAPPGTGPVTSVACAGLARAWARGVHVHVEGLPAMPATLTLPTPVSAVALVGDAVVVCEPLRGRVTMFTPGLTKGVVNRQEVRTDIVVEDNMLTGGGPVSLSVSAAGIRVGCVGFLCGGGCGGEGEGEGVCVNGVRMVPCVEDEAEYKAASVLHISVGTKLLVTHRTPDPTGLCAVPALAPGVIGWARNALTLETTNY